jgi:ribonuclease HI
VEGFTNAMYKAFPTREAAQEAFDHGPEWESKSPARIPSIPDNPDIVKPSLCVDAACSGNPGQLEYRGVWVENQEEVFYQGPFPGGTNNIGEFVAIVHALAWLEKKQMPDMPVYSDSRTAIKWVLDRRANTKLKKSRSNAVIFLLIERAEKWLKENKYNNPLLKWETESWGEIPADFGRK